MKLLFDHEFFHHVNQAALRENGKTSRALSVTEWLMKKTYIKLPLALFEHILGFILTFPIPIYSSIVFRWINGARGLPSFGGMYFRALYYRNILGKMEPNVLIDQDVFIAHPKGVELKSLCYIDKGVILMSRSTKIGRRVHIAAKSFVSGGGDFIAEDYAGVAPKVTIITSTEILRDGARASGPMVSADQRNLLRGTVILRKDSFVGATATIFPNVKIAEGSVVGAGVIMSKSTEDWNIYVDGRATKLGVREKVKHPDN